LSFSADKLSFEPEDRQMTEQEWLDCVAPGDMLKALDPGIDNLLTSAWRGGDRKFRLFAVGCCSWFWDTFSDARSRRAVEVVEQCVDGLADAEARVFAAGQAFGATVAYRRTPEQEATRVAPRSPEEVAAHVAFVLAAWSSCSGYHAAVEASKLWPEKTSPTACGLLRCVFGNPFRPAPIDPAWLVWNGGTVPALAQTVYAASRFKDLAVLADALEEAGCTDSSILGHCRESEPHIRGCWVVDLLRGKV
jgi:hypothetical protein